MIERGEVWWADLGAPRGSAPAKYRPVLVVQDDRANESRLKTTIVAVLTSNLRLAAVPGNVSVPAALSGLPEDSVVNVSQVVTVDRSFFDRRAGVLPPWVLDSVDDGLRRILSL